MKIVFVHGFLGSALNWGPVLSRLRALPSRAGDEFFAVDLLAHGRRGQDPVPRPLTVEAVANDLMTQLPDGPIIGVGHSFGLRPLLKLSAQYPGKLVGLVSEDSTPALSQAGYSQLVQIFDGIALPQPTRETARAEIEKSFGVDTTMTRFLVSNVRELSPGVHGWRFQAEALRELLDEARDHDLWNEWRAYTGPIELITGERSGHVTRERADEAVRNRGDRSIRLTVVPDAGHWVHADQPESFVSALDRALVRLTSLSN